MHVLRFIVTNQWDGRRLNDFLRQGCSLSGTVIKNAKRIEMGITMDGEHIRTVDNIRAGAVIEVKLDAAEKSYPKGETPAVALYEDEDILVLDKMPGMPCHPSKGHGSDTVANAFAALKGEEGLIFRPVGRLDADTSGALLLAKHAHMAYLLNSRPLCRKSYLAIVSPVPKEAEGEINAPVFDDGISTGRVVDFRGKSAVTHYRVLLSDAHIALLSLWLETGRTHQIRVHMAYIGSPLLGDALYGGDLSEINRHALHCRLLLIDNPISGNNIKVLSPLPADMMSIMQRHFFADEIESVLGV